jgi:multiple sugar transport system permease protein
MTSTQAPGETVAVVLPETTSRGRRRLADRQAASERGIISPLDRRRPLTRVILTIIAVIVMAGLTLVCAGPLLWLFKAATSTTTETLAEPFALWPTGLHWENFIEVWTQVEFGRYLGNTGVLMAGSLFFGLLVATTGGYGLAVLKPRYAKMISGALLATLFLPAVISLVSLYLTVVSLPIIEVSLLNTFWAVWLPAAANAVNVLLVQRFFAAIPGEIFEAARIDGAGPFRVFWSIVLPMSRPILGVVSLLTLVEAYKEFLWPLLVLPDPNMQPISVALPRLEGNVDFAQFLAALFISSVIPVTLFLIFQKQFLRSAGSAGALKG